MIIAIVVFAVVAVTLLLVGRAAGSGRRRGSGYDGTSSGWSLPFMGDSGGGGGGHHGGHHGDGGSGGSSGCSGGSSCGGGGGGGGCGGGSS